MRSSETRAANTSMMDSIRYVAWNRSPCIFQRGGQRCRRASQSHSSAFSLTIDSVSSEVAVTHSVEVVLYRDQTITVQPQRTVGWRESTNHKIPCNYVKTPSRPPIARLSSLVMSAFSSLHQARQKRCFYIITWIFVIGRFAPFNGIPQTVRSRDYQPPARFRRRRKPPC